MSRKQPSLPWVFDDGGRLAAGFDTQADDCVTRAIAIATGRPYREVYDMVKAYCERVGRGDPETGVVGGDLLLELGWRRWQRSRWDGTWNLAGARLGRYDVHELPVLLVDVLDAGGQGLHHGSHLVAVIDGVVHDTLGLWTRAGNARRDRIGAIYLPPEASP